uniref:Uncharacterized protein n=1 Tax=Rhinopithecus roxellana TaxID=61622 RepID=A0A2K6NMK5_RHIRO
MEQARDHLHLRWTTDQHMPEVEVQVKYRTAALSNQECQLYLRHSQQQQVPVVDFQARLRQAFITETPRCGKSHTGTMRKLNPSKNQAPSTVCLCLFRKE